MEDKFDFTNIIAKMEAAQEYKRNNYYTNYYKHPIDEYDYTKELIEVEDWDGLKGKMTLYDFARYIGSDPRIVQENILKHLAGEGVSKPLLKRFKENFKKITFMEGLLK